MPLDFKKFEALPPPQKDAISTHLFSMTGDLMKKTQALQLSYEKDVEGFLAKQGLLMIDPKDGRIAELEAEIKRLKAEVYQLHEENEKLKIKIQEIQASPIVDG